MQRENRSQPRIQATVVVEIIHRNHAAVERATLVDLSWGGALIRVDSQTGQVGDRLEVRLPYSPGRPISIESEILRIDDHGDDSRKLAVRFTRLSTEAERHLEKVLDILLSGPGGGRRAHPRLAQRLEVYFDDPADIKATLEDISRGGLSVTVPYSFAAGQSVQLTVLGPPRFRELRLRARVAHQAPVEDSSLKLYRIGLEFEHPTQELQDMVQGMLLKMAGPASTAGRSQ